MSVRLSQEPVEVIGTASPKLRASQVATESVATVTTARLRMSQVVVEVLAVPKAGPGQFDPYQEDGVSVIADRWL